MRDLNAAVLQEFLVAAGSKLRGRWLLIGGTLLPAVGLDVRSTVDIDFVGLGSREAAQGLELMELTEALGLPVETINQAAALFVKKANVRKKELLPLFEGSSATIYRPSAGLYWRLKIPRLSDSDLLDCNHYWRFCQLAGDRLSARETQRTVEKELDAKPSPDRLRRLKKLLQILSELTSKK